MALGYHKLNTSGSRSARRQARVQQCDSVTTRAGTVFSTPCIGDIEVMESFVSDSDKVKCRSISNGEIETLTGLFIRMWLL